MTPTLRIFACALAVAGWLVLLFLGRTLGGAVHVLPLAALALFPWRAPRGN